MSPNTPVTVDPLQVRADACRAVLEVDVTPLEPEHLGQPEAKAERHKVQRLEAVPAQRLDHRTCLIEGQRLNKATSHRRRLHELGGGRGGHKAPADRDIQRGP
ncbi:MAG: hypothetical protein M3276_05670 [Actinomycetota bacterium]|nr:hypothetical protein [Actinomycetota bacterium]